MLRKIINVPIEDRMDVWAVATLLGIDAEILLRDVPPTSMRKAGLIPPLCWIAEHSCTYDRRVIVPWAAEHGDALRAAVKKSARKPRQVSAETRAKISASVRHWYRAQKTKLPASAPIEPPEDVDMIDVVETFGRSYNTHCAELRRRPLGPRSLPVASSDFLAPITRQRLMSGR